MASILSISQKEKQNKHYHMCPDIMAQGKQVWGVLLDNQLGKVIGMP